MNIADLTLAAYVLCAVIFVMGVLVAVVEALALLGSPPRSDADEVVPGPELIAVLGAAAAEVIGKPVHIHRIQLHRDQPHPAWARAGRMDIMLSHRVEPRR